MGMQRAIYRIRKWFFVFIFFFFSSESFVKGVDLSNLAGRFNCYRNEQLNCSQEFTDVYPELSRSANNLSLADTYFLLFTRRNPDSPEKLHKCGGRLPNNTNFNPEKQLIVMMTPFLVDFCEVSLYREWLYEILKKGDYNVLIVDYGWGTKVDYATAIKNARIAAKQSVIVLRNIQEDQNIKNEQVYLIGHSLGGQGVGLIGQDFHVGRITAIDPAGPGFNARDVPPEDRLDPSDADFVDVWHCNAGECLPDLGTAFDVGHVDFWVNDGTHQPGCQINAFKAFLKQDYLVAFGTTFMPMICNHVQCAEYFRASINPGDCQFIGVKCDKYDDFLAGKCDSCGENGENCLIMGFDSKDYLNRKFDSPQRYYLSTKKTCPYCDNSTTQMQGYKQKMDSSPKDASNSDGNSPADAETKESFVDTLIDFVKWLFGFND